MPTIQQLPPASSVDAADQLLISQTGVARAVTVGDLLAATQPAILAPAGNLLGRLSVGPGSPEPVSVGPGVTLIAGTLLANGSDHASFPPTATPADNDQIVLTASGQPRLLSMADLRGWLNIPAQGGTGLSLTGLPTLSAVGASDLLPVNQAGTVGAISLGNLLDGETIDQASPAAPAADTDTVWVAQGGSTMLRQSFSAIWSWVAGRLATYKIPTIEITTDTTLDASTHNGRLLICSNPVTLTAAPTTMGNGFSCEILNLSGSPVNLAGGFITSSGQTTLSSSQLASVRAITYSRGTIAFISVAGGSSGTAPVIPGQVATPSVTGITASGAVINWSVPTTGGTPTSYMVQYAVTGSGAWSVQTVAGGASTATLAGLTSGTSYSVTVIATNAAGSSQPSATATFTTATAISSVSPPGQPTGLASSNPQATSIQLSWVAPGSGGTPTGYTVQYATGGGGAWSTFAAGVAGTSISVTGLSPGTAYQFQVIATNAAGAGTASTSIAASTTAAASVTSITWNLTPSSHYSVGSGAIGVNVHVTPATSAVRFGLSASSAALPTTWTDAGFVNTDLWGAYLSVPSTAGTYYLWCEGSDGSLPTAYANPISVS